MELISLKSLEDLYTIEGARAIFERITVLLLRNSRLEAKSIRVQNGDGGVDSFEGEYGGNVTVYQCKYFLGHINSSRRQQIQKSFYTAKDNESFQLKKWILCIPINMSGKEEEWFSNWKQEIEEQYEIEIDYYGEDFYIQELLKAENSGVRDEYFKSQHRAILYRIEEALNKLPVEKKISHDEFLLNTLLENLDEEFFLSFVENLNTYCRYNVEEKWKLDGFLYWAQKPSNCFVNKVVQQKLNDFLERLDALLLFMGMHFFRRRVCDDGLNHLYPDLNVDLDGEFDKKKMDLFDGHLKAFCNVCNRVLLAYKVFINESKQEIYNK
ncbi:hypothetical protein ABEX67_22825 [Bacillus wiedmannii]|uniref:hypothetical protein n=1 Tax=Bacillus wiedmannii TaxID=1890302 RepID=UPI003D22C0D6